MNFPVEVSFFQFSPMAAANLEDRPLPEKNKSMFDPKGMSETHLPKLQQQEGTMLYVLGSNPLFTYDRDGH